MRASIRQAQKLLPSTDSNEKGREHDARGLRTSVI